MANAAEVHLRDAQTCLRESPNQNWTPSPQSLPDELLAHGPKRRPEGESGCHKMVKVCNCTLASRPRKMS